MISSAGMLRSVHTRMACVRPYSMSTDCKGWYSPCPHRYVLDRKRTHVPVPYICRWTLWKDAACPTKRSCRWTGGPWTGRRPRPLYAPGPSYAVQSFFARVTIWMSPGLSAEQECHPMSMGLVRKYRSRTNKDLPICCAARRPSRSICTTWETLSSPSQLLTALSPSWIWMDCQHFFRQLF